MRREQKKQAENFVKLLETAHDEIRNAIEKKDRKTALILLEDCQNGAIALGNLIEEAEGEGFVTVRLLEEYCEQIYRIYTSFGIEESVGEESGKRVRANQVYKMLRGAMTRIVNSVKRDIGISLEVVFLPYKASMWDSLESVWQAADADPGCNAYVIPIPYYDKKPDGSFGQLHDEGEQYPEYVPVMRYEDYNFEKRKPDMIFIHNPYDDCNYVTSVHPYFYSENLRKFTDNLVYIPYFILGEIHPDNLEELKGIEHFCMAPGVLNADKVIVQSEDMRKAYINVLLADIRKRTEERGQINKANPADGSEYNFADFDLDKTDSMTSTGNYYYMLTAANIKVAYDLEHDPNFLVTMNKPDVPDNVATQDIVVEMLKLKKDVKVFRGVGADQFLACLISDNTVDTQKAKTLLENYSNINETIIQKRMSISGVDEDEEALDMLKFQNAYNLASRMIQTLSEMYNRLILETGV